MIRRIVNMLCSVLGRMQPTSSASKSTRYARPAVECLEERAVPSLTPVTPGSAFPFTAMVKIQATYPDGQTLVGSGALVDSYQVLTAGHVIYSAADGGWASSVKVIPEEYVGANGQLVEPVGYALAQRGGLQTFTNFVNQSRAHPGMFAYGDDDIGLISLDRNIGQRTQSMNFGYYNNGSYGRGTVLSTAGYPATGAPTYNGYHLEYGSGAIAGMSPDGSSITYLQSSIPTYHGQSGSPMWATMANGSRVIVGVVAAGNGTATSLNAATCITPSIYHGLLQMMSTDHAPIGDPISYDPPSYPTGGGTSGGGGTVIVFMSAEIGTTQAGASLGHGAVDAVAVPNPTRGFAHPLTALPPSPTQSHGIVLPLPTKAAAHIAQDIGMDAFWSLEPTSR